MTILFGPQGTFGWFSYTTSRDTIGRRQRLEQSPSYQGTTFMITCHVPLWQLFVKASQGWKRAFLAGNC
ncbi:hypothetical protein [Pseudomonas putida]|uniref:hypothetical protein n=2 Tax=Pseudomonas TaxID=286 RepID=UPI0021179532|nr:hypothetical protein [Pseudomonas putida]